jgi:hypothetical protein
MSIGSAQTGIKRSIETSDVRVCKCYSATRAKPFALMILVQDIPQSELVKVRVT